MPEAAPGDARADGGAQRTPAPRERIARLQSSHGNAALGRVLARFEAGEASQAVQTARDGLDAEHQASADGREAESDQGPVAQRALASAQSAMTAAVGMWQGTATLTGVIVDAVAALGGTLLGPPLAPFMLGSMIGDGTPPEVAGAFANAASTSWMAWSSSVRIPGLPWYPSFAAFPSAIAPPTPNVPSPLGLLTSFGGALSAGFIRAQITPMLGSLGLDPAWGEAAGAFGSWVERNFAVWQVSTLVTNVMGFGTVPSFAPPAVPVGPVVGGTATMPPGGLVGPPFGLV